MVMAAGVLHQAIATNVDKVVSVKEEVKMEVRVRRWL
jgi:hypothetical protein